MKDNMLPIYPVIPIRLPFYTQQNNYFSFVFERNDLLKCLIQSLNIMSQ